VDRAESADDDGNNESTGVSFDCSVLFGFRSFVGMTITLLQLFLNFVLAGAGIDPGEVCILAGVTSIVVVKPDGTLALLSRYHFLFLFTIGNTQQHCVVVSKLTTPLVAILSALT
jgi:hypothetical protein